MLPLPCTLIDVSYVAVGYVGVDEVVNPVPSGTLGFAGALIV